MIKPIVRVVSLVLFGWFVFMLGAMAYAAMKRRDAVPQDPASDEVELVANFAPLEFHSESDAFRGGSVTTMFGGGELDLRNATLAPDGATIRINALFGGGNLVVPESWNVESKLVGIGGVGDGRPKAERPADAPTLRLEGTAIFGGWGISSTPSEEVEKAIEVGEAAEAAVAEAVTSAKAQVGAAQAQVSQAIKDAQSRTSDAAADAAEGASQATEEIVPA